MRRTRHTRARKATIGVVALALVTGIAISAGAALPVTPTPTITSGPSGTVASSSATFTFSDTQAGATFQCKLDAGSFASCTSPKAYTGLVDGSHTFQVTAKATGKDTSAPASRTWTINTTPPTPTITSGPSGTVASSSATFTFSDTQAGATFQCKLDAGSFASCTSPKAFTGLVDGSHTFQVAAKSAGSSLSAPATRSWSVDTTAPAITPSFPVDGAVYTAATWNAGCATASVGDLCGTASDATGVQSVQVAILQWSPLRYWNGTSFSLTGQVFNVVTGTTSWKYPLPVPADGYYTVFVRATDTRGNQTPVLGIVIATFRIDSSAPPAPTITQKPTDPSTDTTATFQFTDSESGAGFRCTLDSGASAPCNPGHVSYTGLTAIRHCFSVVAVDAASNTSAPTQYCWTVQGAGMPFTIAGQATQTLYPGGTSPVNLVFTNPNSVPIQITAVTVTVAHITTHALCDGPTNFQVTQSLTATPTVPANSTKSLVQLGVPSAQWPQLRMPDLPTNQNGCKGTAFTLNYTGTATGS
ncbi:MAG: hypothetical protein ACXV8R_02520 [Acidimicrobiia bacterium]